MTCFVTRLLSLKYLNRWLVLLNDLFISLVSTLSAVLITEFFFLNIFTWNQVAFLGLLSVLSSLFSFYLFKIYKGVIRHSSYSEAGLIGIAVFVKVGLWAGLILLFMSYVPYKYLNVFCLLDLLITFFALINFRSVLIQVYNHFFNTFSSEKPNVLIYRSGKADSVFLNFPIHKLIIDYRMTGFVQIGSQGTYRMGGYTAYSVSGFVNFEKLVKRRRISAVLFLDDQSVKEEQDRFVRYCEKLKVRMLLLPKVSDFDKQAIKNSQLAEVRVEDLLSREEIEINMNEIRQDMENKVVLVTGAAGSIGSEICRQLARFNLKHLVLLDTAETPVHELRLELKEKFPDLKFSPVVGDVRNKSRVDAIFDRFSPQIIYHAAAYKHVPLMEENPCEAVCTNVDGTRIIANAALKHKAEKFVMISTDKAVNPTNVMGASKRLAEMYIQSLNGAVKRGERNGITRFVTTRFGNVLGSNGSVIPLFRKQIAKGGPVTVTHPDIIRYFMTIPEACRLVLEAGTMGRGGEIFVFDMGKPVKIVDLARRMINLAGLQDGIDIEINYTGLRPGEKLYEELLNDKESTLPTPHVQIRVAGVRELNFMTVSTHIDALVQLAHMSDVFGTVRLMKEIVPEYISQNSSFEELDKVKNKGKQVV